MKGFFIVRYKGEEIGRVLVGGCTMTFEEICECAGIELATTEEDYMGSPENGKYCFEDLEIEEE